MTQEIVHTRPELHGPQRKFTSDSVTTLDMFPQTAEIEARVHLHA